jgi:hypothetical protein
MGHFGVYKALIACIFCIGISYVPAQAGYMHTPMTLTDTLSINELVKSRLGRTANSEIMTLAEDFDNIWFSTSLNNEHRAKIEGILSFFQKNNLRAYPYFTGLIEGLSGAIIVHQLDAENISRYLSFIELYIALNEPEKLRAFLLQSAHLLKHNAIYNTSYYKLIFVGGKLEFDEVEGLYVPVEEEEFIADTKEEDPWAGTAWAGTDWDNASWDDAQWNDDGWGNSEWEDKFKGDEFFADDDIADDKLNFLDPAPKLIGPLAVLKKTDLLFLTPFDTFKVTGTSITIELPGNRIVGESGRVDWSAAGLPKDSVFAELNNYHFKANIPALEAEKVNLSYYGLIDQTVEGLFEYRAHPRNKFGKHYPKFISTRAGVNYTGLREKGVTLKGGLQLDGAKISTRSVMGSGSTLSVMNQIGNTIQTKALYFDIDTAEISTSLASITIKHKRDSIYHPGVEMRYNMRQKSLSLFKNNRAFERTPYYSSFFNIFFSTDQILWDINTDSMVVKTISARQFNPAVFESAEYFNEYRFNSLSALNNFHPLLLISNYSDKSRKKVFYLDEMMETLPKEVSVKSVRGSMRVLAENGFIEYDPFNGRIKILDRTTHYVKSFYGQKDYDNMKIESVTGKKANAIIKLNDQELIINGVKEFNLNIKLGVSIQPKDEQVTLLRNRDLRFDGTVKAGNYEYIGEGFTMDYDSFLIDMAYIERIKFNLEKQAKRAGASGERVTLENSLVETAGTLYINHPNNKSARRDFPNYPIFNATQGATVYFLGSEILGGVYDQSLYFVIPPFEIDSVSSSDPASISFEGTFHSGGVFPTFEERLRVMPDNSLGFEHPLPDEGMEIYDGIARVFGKLLLNNNGMQGSDRIEYLSTTLYAPSFVFFKDSVTARGSLAHIKSGPYEGTSFPDVDIENYDFRWLPQKDSMYIKSRNVPFKMYDETAEMKGTLIVNRKALFGMGEFNTLGSVVRSKRFRFREHDIAARQALFIIESSEKNKPALRGNGVRLSFDLEKRQAMISPERQGRAAIDFPFAQYKTSIPNATWNLDDRTVSMRKPADVPIKNSYFYSTRKDQDSLVFNATEAIYDIDRLELKVSGIPYIVSADAKIIPENNEALILANAEIQDFFNARLVLDTLNEYHRLFDGNIKILSRRKFEGNATYRYVNAVGDTFNIVMGEFDLQETRVSSRTGRTSYRTVSKGEVNAMDLFLIAPGMYYKGNVTMFADKPALELDGHVKLDLKSIPGYDTWIRYASSGDKKEIRFDFNNSVTEMGDKLTAGLHFETGINDMYATFIFDKRSPLDEDFFIPSGDLFYENKTNEFIIEDPKKAAGKSYKGKIFAFNEATTDVRFEGPLQFIHDQNKEFHMMSAGSGLGNIDRNEFSFNTLMLFKFSLPRQSIQMMGQDALEVIERVGAPEANKDFSSLLTKVAEIIGHEATKAYEERLYQSYMPLYSAGRALLEDMVLSNVDLKWSEGNSSWYSVGRVGLSHFGPFDINASVDGFVEIRKRLEGEVVSIFLQISPACWFYFKYENNELLFYSANDEINRVVQSKSRAGKAKVGQYIFQTVDIQEVKDFIREFRRTYYNIDAPYFLEMAGSESYSAPATPVQSTWEDKKDDDDGF